MRGKHLVLGLAWSAEEQKAKRSQQSHAHQERLPHEKVSKKLLAAHRLPQILNMVIPTSEAILQNLRLPLRSPSPQTPMIIQIFLSILTW